MATPVLPYPDMDFTPFDILTAEEMDEIVANVEYLKTFCGGLADGSNLSDGVIQARKLDTLSIRQDFPIANVAASNRTVNSDAYYDQYAYTVPADGRYFVCFSQIMVNGTNNYDFYTRITKNGTEITSSGSGGGSYVNYIQGVSVAIIDAMVGDLIKCQSKGGGSGVFTTARGRVCIARIA